MPLYLFSSLVSLSVFAFSLWIFIQASKNRKELHQTKKKVDNIEEKLDKHLKDSALQFAFISDSLKRVKTHEDNNAKMILEQLKSMEKPLFTNEA